MSLNTYDIIVLGAMGSGKTVFLASMYHRLCGQEDTTQFFLYAPPPQKKMLLAKYEEIIDTKDASSPWPTATRREELPAFTFTCRVRTGEQKIHDAFQFNYWDYAGGMITNLDEGEAGERFSDTIEARFPKAHALLGILDGHKIFALMTDVPIKADPITSDIRYILPEMENNENPAHFIITKWDVLESKFTLQQVRDWLLQNIPRLRQFIDSKKSKGTPIRFIPVSSVGVNFADPKIEDGVMSMVKKPGAIPHPLNVEMPLACVIPDKLKVELQKLKEEEERTRNASVVVAPKLGFFAWLGKVVSGAINVIQTRLPPELRLSDSSLRRLTQLLTSGARAGEATAAAESERLLRERDASLEKVTDQKSAVDHVIKNFISLIKILEAEYPHSNIKNL
jgi:hypothetical protein